MTTQALDFPFLAIASDLEHAGQVVLGAVVNSYLQHN